MLKETKNKPVLTFSAFLIIATFFTMHATHAQELPPPEIDLMDVSEQKEEPQGTLNPSALQPINSNDDEVAANQPQVNEQNDSTDENEADESGIRDEDLFGDDNNSENQDITNKTHLLKFELNGTVVFMTHEKNAKGETVAGEPYLEVVYQFIFEAPINLSSKKSSESIEASIDADHYGSLAKNEFFDCQLDIDIPKIPVEITSKIQREEIKENKDDEDAEQKKSLILKLDFDRNIREDWFSLCTDFGGTTLNTQGDTEDYHSQILKLLDPSPSSLIVEDFDETDRTTIDLATPQKIINDLDIHNDISLSAGGKITIEPL